MLNSTWLDLKTAGAAFGIRLYKLDWYRKKPYVKKMLRSEIVYNVFVF